MTEELDEMNSDNASSADGSMVGNGVETNPPAASGKGGGKKRVDVAFPKLDLAAAIKIAEVVYAEGGQCDPSVLAKELGNTPSSGAFVQKVAAGRSYGVIDRKPESIGLTKLGERLVQPDRSAQAKVDAFLGVQVFKDLYEKYKGIQLPPAAGIEKYVASALGLGEQDAKTLVSNFLKSGRTAGFFDRDEQRPLLPRGTSESGEILNTGNGADDENKPPTPVDADILVAEIQRLGAQVKMMSDQLAKTHVNDLHPAIQGMLATLPKEDEAATAKWDATRLATWANTFTTVLHFVYDVQINPSSTAK